MLHLIICHYTFHSNEVNPFFALLFFLGMAIFLIVAIYIWIGNKIDDYKLNDAIKRRDAYLEEEALAIIVSEAKLKRTFQSIENSSHWRKWFVKGYKEGAINGNSYYSPFEKYKPKSEYTIEEWENFQSSLFGHIKEDSEYFNGSKKNTLLVYFWGHEYGLKRFQSQGEAK
ncbi:MAG: hypothetical protein IKJ52_09290 [Muribaculaceae bacterium]|nr:hypothetical protein [Muribaculaceae bacterium]